MNVLQKTKQRIFNKRVFGFDIETYNNNKSFLMASIVGLNKYNLPYEKVFYDKDSLIHELKTNYIFRDSYIFATNLSFDFFGTFFSHDESKNFNTLFRGTDLLFAKTYFKGDEFTSESCNPATKSKKYRKCLTFLDSMNYAKLSVSKMGEIIGISKYEHPSFLGQYPKNEKEWDIMKEYNIRDSYITYKFMLFLIKSFEELGATFKNTIASTSMSLFKNKYLTDKYYQPDQDILIEHFKAYYGGRTEALKRGYFSDMNYYDFNSLYPSVMKDNEFPDPNSMRVTFQNTNKYINSYEGISDIEIEIPECDVPVLPYRCDNGKVIFPTGKLKGFYTHIEIREAINQGAILTKVNKTYYFLRNCKPFEGYVTDLYSKRMEYKSDNNPMELVTKLMLNSLYGKFGQKFLDKENTFHQESMSLDKLSKFKTIDRVGDYFVVKQDCKPSNFCVPIWACYVTAYGRLKLHKELIKHDVIYCDTDSIICKDEIQTSKKLGDLKLEMQISEGIVVRPKFYALKEKGHEKEQGYVKIKGLGKRLNYYEFVGLLYNPKISYDKFAKFKESLRRDFIPNEIVSVHKEFSLNDEKREWSGDFNYRMFENSKPVNVNNIIESQNKKLRDKELKQELKIIELMNKRNGLMDLTGEDTFDSMGNDITKEEYLKNEISYDM